MNEEKKNVSRKQQCFVIMPIGDPEGYAKGHFKHVYEDLFIPAIEEAKFEPKRADDDKSSNMIQVNIIRDIIESPMAICDLSSRNPNVLFELGIRQAFDLPVVLVQEKGTPRIFDISTINTLDYRKDLIYREVMEDRKNIVNAIDSTKDKSKGVNSIIKLLKITNAQIPEKTDLTDMEELKMMFFSLQKDVNDIRNNILNIWSEGERITFSDERSRKYYNSLIMEAKSRFTLSENMRMRNETIVDLQSTIKEIENNNNISVFCKNELLDDAKTTLRNMRRIVDNNKLYDSSGIVEK